MLMWETRPLGSQGLLWPPTLAPFTLDLGPHSLQAVGVCREQEEDGIREGQKDDMARGRSLYISMWEGIALRVLSWDIIQFILDHSTV